MSDPRAIRQQQALEQDADLILVLKRGRIVEHGTHQELIGLGGPYCELFRISLQELGQLPEGQLCDSSR